MKALIGGVETTDDDDDDDDDDDKSVFSESVTTSGTS
jgi:hypothetical protein